MRPLLEDHVAEPGREIDRDKPGDDQRYADYVEERADILTGGGFRKAHGNETRRGDQRACQHREGCRGIGETRGIQLVEPLLQLSLHHLDNDHRVVNEQTKRNDQSAERDALKIEAEFVHHGEGGSEHQRNGDRDDQTRAPADRYEGDDENDQKGLTEGLHELANRFAHDFRLIGDLRDFEADRQSALEAFQSLLHRIANVGDLKTLGHDHADLDGILAVEPEFALIGIFQTFCHCGDVAEARDLAAGIQPKFANVLRRREATVDRDAHRARPRVDGPCRIDGILSGQRVLQVGKGEAALGQRLGRDLDEDLLWLVAQDDGLFDTLGREQHIAGLDGILLQLRIAVAIAGQGIERDIGIAEFIIEVRAKQAFRQLVLDIADLLANLVEGIRHIIGIRVALDLQGDDRGARARVGLYPVEIGRFLQLALDLVDHLVLHVGQRSAWPEGLNHHHTEGEIGIFLLSHAHQPEEAGQQDQAEEKARDARMADRPAGQVKRARLCRRVCHDIWIQRVKVAGLSGWRRQALLPRLPAAGSHRQAAPSCLPS